ncbi:MAG: hypothetical protein K6G26_06815 [Lachnospiraceae bacterium]|jgi:hypothetical protein|nr:hypothetical protein [Lachnospiraceae bacterium]
MGLDLYIEAKITEKATGRCITAPHKHDPDYEEDLYFTVILMFGSDAYPIRNSWIDIINRHLNTSYGYDDLIIPIPQSALREICSCLYSYICLPESNRFEHHIQCGFWDIKVREKEKGNSYSFVPKDYYKSWNIRDYDNECRYQANYLYDFIELIERIHYENRYIPLKADDSLGIREDGTDLLPDDYITSADDLKKFKENPQAYEWTFRIFNSF